MLIIQTIVPTSGHRIRSEEEDFRAQASTCIGMQLGKGKNCFIKCDISRYIDTPRCNVQTFIPLVKITISQKNTSLRTELEFMGIIWTKIWPTSTTKNP